MKIREVLRTAFLSVFAALRVSYPGAGTGTMIRKYRQIPADKRRNDTVERGDGIRLKPFLRGSVQIADRDLFRRFLHYRKHPQTDPSSVVPSARGILMTRRD